MPVTVVPTSLATVAIATFMTELSRVIRNWPDARVSRTTPVFCVRPTSVTRGWYPEAGTLDPRRRVARRRRRGLPPGRDPIDLDVDRETQRDPYHDDQPQRQRAGKGRTHHDRADDVRDDEDLQTQQDRAAETRADVVEHTRGVFAVRQLDDAANERDETADDQDQDAEDLEGLDGVAHHALEHHARTLPPHPAHGGKGARPAPVGCADDR